MPEIASYVVVSGQPTACVAFYRALGLPLEDEAHEGGPLHWAAEVSGVHVAVYACDPGGSAPGHRQPGSTFVGWWVPDLDETRRQLSELGRVGDREHTDWGGCRFVAHDPDGRPVEVNQRDHC